MGKKNKEILAPMQRVRLNVGGTILETTMATLESGLEGLFSSCKK